MLTPLYDFITFRSFLISLKHKKIFVQICNPNETGINKTKFFACSLKHDTEIFFYEFHFFLFLLPFEIHKIMYYQYQGTFLYRCKSSIPRALFRKCWKVTSI